MSIYNLFKNVAFRLDPELVHDLSMSSFGIFPRALAGFFSPLAKDPRYIISAAGLNWSFPIGLAAGLDKNAAAITFFSRLKFGAIEVGTVTPLPQEGNPKPRLFRFPAEESLLNRMGFNNRGMEKVFDNIVLLSKDERPTCLGVNLGKNKITSEDQAANDYLKLYTKFAPVADYLVVNVSSPNTPGLRDLQGEQALATIFDALKVAREKQPVPLFLKVAPDLSNEGLDACVEISKRYELAGLIATNTTIMPERGQGGVSGRLLKHKATQVRDYLLERLSETPKITLIGVGGVSDFDDLWHFWCRGGRLMQIYSSFIYQGPKILDDMAFGIDTALKKTGAKNVSELLADYQKLPRDWRL